jgi:hypothetical protein
MLRFGGEDEAAALDPKVNTNVVGGDPVEAADMGLRNIDRVMPLLIPGTTRRGGDYARLREMYATLIMQRHRELAAVAKVVGGVEETRYQAGRGSAPFKPTPPARQRAAVKFLVDRAFVTPRALLDPEVLMRVSPTGGADILQGSNVQLLQQLLDGAVFQRMAEAKVLDAGGKSYVGIDLLYDLNDGLFRELAAPKPSIELYRRELQRNYVTLLLVATGVTNDPESGSNAIASRDVDSGSLLHTQWSSRSLSSPLADVARQYRLDRSSPSEFRSALRTGVAHLYAKIEVALKRTKDPETASHLRDIRSQLGQVP